MKQFTIKITDAMKQHSYSKKWQIDLKKCWTKLKKIFKMTKEQKRWESLPDIDNETIKIWLNILLERTHKMHIEELSVEEIKAEIEETKGSIENFSIWEDRHAIVDSEEYIEILEEILERRI